MNKSKTDTRLYLYRWGGTLWKNIRI